jgi:L-fucose isomerase-like protein
MLVDLFATFTATLTSHKCVQRLKMRSQESYLKRSTPKKVTGELGSEADAQKAFDWMKGKKIGAVGDAPIGFTPCVYDAQQIRSLFGLDIRQITIDDAFGKNLRG